MFEWLKDNIALISSLAVAALVVHVVMKDFHPGHDDRPQHSAFTQSQGLFVNDCRSETQAQQSIELSLNGPASIDMSGSGAGSLCISQQSIPAGGLALASLPTVARHKPKGKRHLLTSH